MRDAQSDIKHFLALYTDITAKKKHEHELERLAHYDTLTKLPNRTLFYDRLQVCLAKACRNQDSLGLLFLDLDGFKAINDRYGHET